MMAWSVSWASSMTHFDSLARWRMSRRIAATRSTSGEAYSSSHSGTAGDVLDQVGDVVGEEVDGCDEEVTAAHCRVEDLQIEDSLRRIQLEQLGSSFGLGPAVALELPRLFLESLQALLDSGLRV